MQQIGDAQELGLTLQREAEKGAIFLSLRNIAFVVTYLGQGKGKQSLSLFPSAASQFCCVSEQVGLEADSQLIS